MRLVIKYLSCITLFVSIVIYFTWDSNAGLFLFTKEYDYNRKLAIGESYKGDSCILYKDFNGALEHYKTSYNLFKTDSIIAKIISYEQHIGNVESALNWLAILENRIGCSDFIELRRAGLILQGGDSLLIQKKHIDYNLYNWYEKICHLFTYKHKNSYKYEVSKGENKEYIITHNHTLACSLLECILNNPVQYQSIGFIRLFIFSFWDSINNSNVYKIEEGKRCYRYYADYLGKLFALNLRLQLAKDNKETFDLGRYLFKLAEDKNNDYEIMNKYQNWQYQYKSYKEEIRLHILYSCGYFINEEINLSELVSDIKWNHFNKLIIDKHIQENSISALKYANDITLNNTCNTDAYHQYSKFLYGIYMASSDNNLFPGNLTAEDLDFVLQNSIDKQTNCIPVANLTIGIKNSNWILGNNDWMNKIEGDKIILPIIILECNDWNWKNSNINFHEYVQQNTNNFKSIKYINNDFKACNSSTCEEKFGLIIQYVPSNMYILNLLQMEYNKQQKRNIDL